MAGILELKIGDIISTHHIYTELLYPNGFNIGFPYIGLIFVLCIIIPNIILIFNDEDDDTKIPSKNFFNIASHALMCLCSITAMIFKDFNLIFYISDTSFLISYRIGYFILAVFFIIMYSLFFSLCLKKTEL